MVFKKSLHPCALDESSLSIGRVKRAEKEFEVTLNKKIVYLEEKLGKKMIQDNHSYGSQNGTPHH